MAVEQIDTLVIGAGQAGIAASEHLRDLDVSHLIVEKSRIAEHWRSARWDSLVANGPAWHDRFPNMTFADVEPDAFAPKEKVADYFEAYARQIKAPVRCGVAVTSLTKDEASKRFRAETSDHIFEARNIVVATGPFQKPVMPTLVPEDAGLMQIHSNRYRNPGQLLEGAVLVVGAGSSGAQIADELQRAGRKVFLSVGRHNKPPRRYRGHDYCWWLGVLGIWDKTAPNPGMEHITIAVSGAYGGRTVDFRNLAQNGMTLLGRAARFDGGTFYIADDLQTNLREGDADYRSVLDAADAYAIRHRLDLPEEPEARRQQPDPVCVTKPLLSLDLKQHGITSIVWATGYALDFNWIELDAFHANGRPRHVKGVAEVEGLYFLGLPWLSRRASSFIWGVWHDARHVAEHISARQQ
jgi:putative flavoprotein involved in K+ transport